MGQRFQDVQGLVKCGEDVGYFSLKQKPCEDCEQRNKWSKLLYKVSWGVGVDENIEISYKILQ